MILARLLNLIAESWPYAKWSFEAGVPTRELWDENWQGRERVKLVKLANFKPAKMPEKMELGQLGQLFFNVLVGLEGLMARYVCFEKSKCDEDDASSVAHDVDANDCEQGSICRVERGIAERRIRGRYRSLASPH